MTSLKTHAVREFQRNESDDDIYVEEIQRIGHTVIESGFSPEELQTIRTKIDEIYEKQLSEIGGPQQLARINDEDLARALLAYDEYFLALAAHPRIMSITKKLLGENFELMSQNAIINRSRDEHYQTTWHRDLNYQHFISSRPLAISALYAIDEFTEQTGGTYLLPASHKHEVFPSEEYVKRHEQVTNAKAGAILLFDAMLYHRAGENRSGRTRRAVNHIYTLPLIKQQISFPRMLKGRFSNDPSLRTLLGFGFETAESVQHWREFKISQAK